MSNINQNDVEAIYGFVKALGSESRIKILMAFMDGKDRTVNEVVEAVNLGQSTCSEHLAILKRAGIMRSEKQGKEVIYSPNRELIATHLEQLGSFLRRCC